MKLVKFEQKAEFTFSLCFENGQTVEVDLEPLIGSYICATQLRSAEIDSDWGCLQFNGGAIDIEPNTLYRFALSKSGAQAA